MTIEVFGCIVLNFLFRRVDLCGVKGARSATLRAGPWTALTLKKYRKPSSNASAKGNLCTARRFPKPSKRTHARSQKSLAARNRRDPAKWNHSVGGISRKFEVRQPHTLIHDLIRSDICGSFESFGATTRYIVVLVHAVAAHTQSAGQSSVSK